MTTQRSDTRSGPSGTNSASWIHLLVPEMPNPPDDDPLSNFELPPDVMSSTFEHAISDAAAIAHERGHSVAAGLQRKLKGSIVEYGFSGLVTAHLRSGAVARCGGPAIGWRVAVERTPGAEATPVDVDLAPGETDTKRVVARLAKARKRW